MPAELTLAMVLFELAQLADAPTSAFEPSLYVAVAVSCCVPPTMRGKVAGVIEIAASVFACGPLLGAGAAPHPVVQETKQDRTSKEKKV
jgi:hypothetical protein